MAAAEDGSQTYNNIVLVGKGLVTSGAFRLQTTGLNWKSKNTGKTVSINGTDIVTLSWMKSAHGSLLRVKAKDGNISKFEGFREQDFSKVAEFCKNKLKVELQQTALCTKGWNWGKMELDGSSVAFKVENLECFEIPLTDIANSALNQKDKNEILLEFHLDDTQHQNKDDESLVEMRLYVPPQDNVTAEMLNRSISENADFGSYTGEGIALFADVPMLTPRGRYEVEMYPTFMRLHGKSYDYKVLYTSIARLFVLPKPDNLHVFFVISLDPPIRQGQTHYPHLVMQFPVKQPVDITLNITKEQLETKYKDKLQQTYTGEETHNVVTKVLKGLTGKKVFGPGSFKKNEGTSCCVRCSLKANDGLLYPLEKSFFFLHKPPTYIRHEEIAWIEFSRVAASMSSASTKNFDLTVQTTTTPAQTHTFTNVPRAEYDRLFEFLTQKQLTIKNIAEMNDGPAQQVEDDDSEDEEDYDENEDPDVDEEEEEDSDYHEDDDDDAGGSSAKPKPKENGKKEDKDKDKEKSKQKEKEKEKKPRSDDKDSGAKDAKKQKT